MIQRNTNTFYSLLFLAALVLAPSASQAQVAESDSIDGVDEVVVVGYGTQKKSNVTGAISKVKSKDLQDVPLTRVEQALQGRTSGVQILQNSGQPGSSSVVRIRGTASINGSNPLYVVDGVVITGGIDYLNPNDIETIEVLKDAASAAIYGARGANCAQYRHPSGRYGRIPYRYRALHHGHPADAGRILQPASSKQCEDS